MAIHTSTKRCVVFSDGTGPVQIVVARVGTEMEYNSLLLKPTEFVSVDDAINEIGEVPVYAFHYQESETIESQKVRYRTLITSLHDRTELNRIRAIRDIIPLEPIEPEPKEPRDPRN